MLTEDFAPFLDTVNGFAVTATYKGSTPVTGIFDNGYLEVPGIEVGNESAGPSFLCKTADVSAAVHGDALVVNTVSYQVIGVHPDGTGLTLLKLEKQ